jgi:hypothetical protein
MKTKFAVIIYFTFILFTTIGTLSHEFGHFIVGRYLGYESTIHYGFTKSGDNPLLESKGDSIYQRNKEAIQAQRDYPDKPKMLKLFKINTDNHFWIISGGPFSTMLTGTIGLVLIIFIRKKHQFASKLSHWLCLFFALTWGRQPTNLLAWILGKPINGSSVSNGDEIKLAKYYLEIPDGTIIWITGILGLFVGGYVILKFVPRDKLITFLISGFLGGVSGIILWLKILGPIVLP